MKAAIVGSGLIGRAWAVVFARGGAEVALWDQDLPQVERAGSAIAVALKDMAEAGLIENPEQVLKLIKPAGTLAAALDGARHVQENIVEMAAPKQALFAEMEKHADADTILASSTSAIMPSILFSQLNTRHRCLVAHPMNPPHLAAIVELCGGSFTAPEAITRTEAFMVSCGMAPIVVKKEIEGFILNRLQLALFNEAFRLISQGYVSTGDLDKTLTEGLALRWSFMGPIETMDLNAPDGVADYMARYGATIRRVGQSLADVANWPSDMGERLDAERRKVLPREGLAAAQAWRDRRLMALASHKRMAEKKFPK